MARPKSTQTYPPLTTEQRDLVTENTALAYGVVRKRFGGLPRSLRSDADAEAMLALCEAAQRFDPSRGNQFSTFATWWVWGRLMSFTKRSREQYHGGIPEDWPHGEEHDFGASDNRLDAEHYLNQLDQRRRIVMRAYFDFDAVGDRGVNVAVEVGKRLGVSPTRVKQIRQEALLQITGSIGQTEGVR